MHVVFCCRRYFIPLRAYRLNVVVDCTDDVIPLASLSVMAVRMLLDAISMSEYKKQFTAKDLNGAKLEFVSTVEDLTEIGILMPIAEFRYFMTRLKDLQAILAGTAEGGEGHTERDSKDVNSLATVSLKSLDMDEVILLLCSLGLAHYEGSFRSRSLVGGKLQCIETLDELKEFALGE